MTNANSTVRMTASLAEQLFRTAKPITPSQLTEQHLDMLQMSDLDIATRVDLGIASDCIRAGLYSDPSVIRCMDAFNARCGRL